MKKKKNNIKYLLYIATEYYENNEYQCCLDDKKHLFNKLNELIKYIEKTDFKLDMQKNCTYLDIFEIYRIENITEDDIDDIEIDNLEPIFEFNYVLNSKSDEKENIEKYRQELKKIIDSLNGK